MMKTNEMKRILADKLKEEETGFTFKDISVTKAKMPMTSTWNDEKGDWNIELVDATRVVIKDFEHFHFFIREEVDDYFGNEVWIWGKHFYPDTNDYSNEGSEIIYDNYGKYTSFDTLITEALLNLGYYIATRF